MNRPPRGAALIEQLQCAALLTEALADQPFEERSQPRYELAGDPLEVHFTTHRQRNYVALLADISANGARFVADYIPAEDEVIQLVFTIGGRRHVLNGRVRHAGAPEGELLCFFGVEFTNQPLCPGRCALDGAVRA